MILSKGLLCQLRPNRIPLYFIFCRPIFMFSTKNSKEDWEDCQQRSIIAFHMMKRICEMKDIYRAPLFSKDHIKNRIQAQANQLKTKKIIPSNWQLKEENINKVWQGFDSKTGCLVNLNIWRQSRFKSVAIFGRIVLMPSFVTGEVFHQLLPLYVEGISKTKFVISGQKGTGKSFAYLIYDYLSQFIISYRMSEDYLQQPQSLRLWSFVEKEQFNNVKKLIYLPLRQVPNVSSAFDHLSLQTNIKKITQIQVQDKSLRLQRLVENFKRHYKTKHGIQLLCIIDEANIYYSHFRQMLKQYNPQRKFHSDNQNFKKLSENSALLQLFDKNCFQYIVFNSSQIIEANLIKHWNKSGKSPKYFCIYEHQKTEYENCFIKYSVAFENSFGDIYLYRILWQNMWRYFGIATNQRYRQKEKLLKKIFSTSFRLSCDKQNQLQPNDEMIRWKINARHLNVRSVCQNKNEIEKKFLQILQNESKQQINRKILLKLKQQVQIQTYLSIKQRFLKFYNQSTNKTSHNIRFQIICLLNSCAYHQIIKKNLKASQNQQIFNLSQQHDERYFVEVDFNKMLQNINTTKVYSLQQKQIINNNLFGFAQEVGLGYKNTVDPLKYRFFINPVLLWKITLLLDEQFIKDSSLQFRLLIRGFKVTHYTGNHLDCLYFSLFKKYQITSKQQKKQFTLILDNWQPYSNELKYKPNSYLIAGAVGFQFRQFITHKYQVKKSCLVDWRIQLADVFDAASKYIGKYILGFCKQKDVLNEDIFSPKNPIFDFVLAKFQQSGTQKQFQALFIDSSAGNIAGKINKMQARERDIRRLVFQLKQMEVLKDLNIDNISCKFLILGTQTKVKKFFSQPLKYNQKKFCDQSFQSNKIGKIKINYGVRAANYFVRGRHIMLSQDNKNFENLIFSTMKEVVSQLQHAKTPQ